ncbi:MAG: VacJ family lipoprotein [Candidatus Marinamargulisbacteria bacterium]|nr:VacJ family lipoprotein [Candidatus Marinamargulisbacteria bacterium]
MSAITVANGHDYSDDFFDEYMDSSPPVAQLDPWMPMNRVFFEFNNYVYISVVRPTTRVYQFLFPRIIRKHVKQVVETVYMPVDIANYLLQGRVAMAAQQTGRFVVNATVGVGGILDVADAWMGWDYQPTGFGDTLRIWGVPRGPYLVLPILGPTTLRGTANVPVQYYVPALYLSDDIQSKLWVGKQVSLFENLVNGYDAIYANSLDPYSVVREWQLSKGD